MGMEASLKEAAVAHLRAACPIGATDGGLNGMRSVTGIAAGSELAEERVCFGEGVRVVREVDPAGLQDRPARVRCVLSCHQQSCIPKPELAAQGCWHARLAGALPCGREVGQGLAGMAVETSQTRCGKTPCG